MNENVIALDLMECNHIVEIHQCIKEPSTFLITTVKTGMHLKMHLLRLVFLIRLRLRE